MNAFNAPALREPARSRRMLLYGTHAQLAVRDGGIDGHFALAACDRRAGVATYALRIDNTAGVPLRAQMFCTTLSGSRTRAYPLDVQIAPSSRCDTLLPVRMLDVGPFDRAIVQVSGENVAFSLEAPAPIEQPRRVPWVTAFCGFVALAVGCGTAAAIATPKLSMLAAPTRVYAGEPLEIPYAYAGWASLRYALKTADGRQIAAGLLHDREGTLHFRVPSGANDMSLNVDVAGPFGHETAWRNIVDAGAVPHRASPHAVAPLQVPRIASFSLLASPLRAGADAAFTYSTDAQTGEIWLIDETGRLWAQGAIDSSGRTVLRVPQGAAGHQIRAVLRAQNGSLDAVASLGATVLPSAPAGGADASSGSHAPPAVPETATLDLSKSTANAGETITVSLSGAHGEASIVVNDSSGNAVENGDISDGQDSLTFTAPGKAGVYYVVATVTEGVGQQTLVKTLNVRD